MRIEQIVQGAVRGFVHRPAVERGIGMVLTHGAGSSANSPLLVAVAEAFCANGYAVLRCDLPFRQRRPFGPPSPAGAAEDRAGLREACSLMRTLTGGTAVLGGHSYGGRQASMLAADEPEAASRLLLLSYPLHPPDKPGQLRTQHFARLRMPALFVHGSKDPFGTIAEMEAALRLIPAPAELMAVDAAGHDLRRGKFDMKALVERMETL